MSAEDAIRHAAQRLGQEFGSSLPMEVERQLHIEEEVSPRFEPASLLVALAALLVSAGKAAWDIRKDLKSAQKDPPAPAVLERQLRVKLQIDGPLTPDQRDRAIAVVVEEVSKSQP
jgi:hypothetical protein